MSVHQPPSYQPTTRPHPTSRIVVTCLRDPDAATEFVVDGPGVTIVDIDLGYADLDDPNEMADWLDSAHEDLSLLEEYGATKGAEMMRSAIQKVEDMA